MRLRCSIFGTNVDPDSLTTQFGVAPSRTFLVGESRRSYARDKAGWDWESAEAGPDIEAILATFLNIFSPYEAVFHRCVEEGATVILSISGTTEVAVVDSPKEAGGRPYEASEPFSALLDSDRVELFFDIEFLRFLTSISASLQTHIDIVPEGESV